MHSEYSVSDGIVRIDEAVKRAAADRMPALALTDAANLFGMVKFYGAARAAGVKPIVGADCWIENEAERDKPARLLLLCASRAGYGRLCELLSRAWLTNQYRGRSLIARQWFEAGTDGLIALSGFLSGELASPLLSDHGESAERIASRWSELFPGRYYVEVQRAGQPNGEALLARSVALASRLRLPVVATHPVQFLEADGFNAHEARVCIAQGFLLGDQRRPRAFTPEQYFKSQDEMARLFADAPQALENSLELARRCNLEIELGRTRLPVFPTPAGVTLDEHLRNEAHAGLERRSRELSLGADAQARYAERLEFEIRTIVQMGFAGYFLIVADFINWARQNAVPVGPGRCSGAGSLVAYSLGITDLDPLRYELLFERFLNPERVSMPDFDIDFCQDGRDRVIDYVRNKYGAESVSQIATFGTMAAKAVVRDVGRVLGMPYGEVDRIAKLVPFELGITLEKALAVETQLRALADAEEEGGELMGLARALEGLTRNVGMHAGGVLIAPGKLTDFTPLYCTEGSSATVSQFDKEDVEKAGLVKFDFLGLTTLTIIAETERNIRALTGGDFDIQRIPLDDPAAYKVFSAGNTVAIFQFESRGMRDLIMKARHDRLEDLIALNALYRPGPMDLIPEFIERKHGRVRWDYLDPRLKDILEPTYGVMTYQEQVMTIAQVIGGYMLGSADLLRRAMGKKKPEEMAKQRAIFLAGAADRGLAPHKAEILFDQMEKFAGYGFNKSHSAAYALIAYQTAYLKAHHAAAFMAANLSALMDDTDKVHILYDDAVKNGLAIDPPDINTCGGRFQAIEPRRIRYGLGAVKGTGTTAIANIVAAREAGGPFGDLADFCRRVDRRIVNRRAMEALIRAGAFDRLEANRASLAASLGAAIELAEKGAQFAQQTSLFGAEAGAAAALELARVAPWSERERLTNEKQSLGFYLSGHPFNAYREELRRFARTPLASLVPQNDAVYVAGVIYGVVVRNSRRGRMAVLTLDDGSARVEIVVFGELFQEKRAVIQEDQVVVVQGRASTDDFSGGMRITADKLMDLAELRAAYARVLRLSINGQADSARLKSLLAQYGGGQCQVAIRFRNEKGECDIRLPESCRVKISAPLLDSLAEWLDERNVEVVY